jgi:hypothetical protein
MENVAVRARFACPSISIGLSAAGPVVEILSSATAKEKTTKPSRHVSTHHVTNPALLTTPSGWPMIGISDVSGLLINSISVVNLIFCQFDFLTYARFRSKISLSVVLSAPLVDGAGSWRL